MSDLAIVIDDEKRVGQEDKPRDNIGRKAGADGIETRIDGCVSSEGWHGQQGTNLPGEKSEPRGLDSGGAGNRTFEAYREDLPRGGYESPGGNNSERIVASKMKIPEGRARNRRAKAE